MSYISASRFKDEVLIWERKGKERIIKTKKAPFYFYEKGEGKDAKYDSMYGDKLIRRDFKNSHEFYEAKKENESSDIEMFESDIPPELKLLSKEYYGVPAPDLNVTFFDIEVDYNPEVGFASITTPYAPINSVALFHRHFNEYVLYAVPPNFAPRDPTDDDYDDGEVGQEFLDALHDIDPLPDEQDLRVVLCPNEKVLLEYFLAEIHHSDVISGWNSDFFDVPYVCKRVELVLGKKALKKMSFDRANPPKYRDVEVMGNVNTTVDLDGRISADYMVIFKKYEMAERPSYKLESIAEEILPDLPKLEYEESLATQYRKNFMWFIRYNLRDTEILEGFEQRLGYIALANDMYHLSTGLFKHVTGTLKLAELATINECHHDLGGKIVNDVDRDAEKSSIQGAFVLLPQVGLHENIGSVDINSLYPSAIRSINISPETLIGQFIHEHRDVAGTIESTWNTKRISEKTDDQITFKFDDTTQVPDELRGEVVTAKAKSWHLFLTKRNWAVSGYGTVFDQNVPGIIPTILANWYAKRKEYQKLKYEAEEQGDKIKAAYYDRLQYVYKIKLNSFYGALTNAYFRFYDLRMGESTTGTGRMILIHQCAKVCEFLDGTYQEPDIELIDESNINGVKHKKVHVGYSNKWSNLYSDTDSSYFRIGVKDKKKAIEKADAAGVFVTTSFPEYMRTTFLCSDGFDTIIKTGREIVSDRGILVDKKRYILHIIDNEGTPTDKLKVMGLDTKKTTLPKEISKVLNKFVERFLKGEDWDVIAKDIVEYKDYIQNTTDLMAIGLPKGVNKVEHYTRELEIYGEGAKIPGHVRASILYNMKLKEYNDTESMRIVSGTKIKVFYVKEVVGKFKAIAIPVDIETFPEWFSKNFTIDRKMHIERLVDKPLDNIIKAIGKITPSKQSLLQDSVLEY